MPVKSDAQRFEGSYRSCSPEEEAKQKTAARAEAGAIGRNPF
jgi:hypothetical protein